jgi:hypothetical protein
MSAPANGTEIIIKGGSVEVEFDGNTYTQDPANPRKHKNQNKKITRVVITGEISFDSGDVPSGLDCKITATCK